MRPIRSFVRRNGRMTPNQKQAFENLWLLYGMSLPPFSKGAAERQRSGGFFDQIPPSPSASTPSRNGVRDKLFKGGVSSIYPTTPFKAQSNSSNNSNNKKTILEIGFGMGHSLIAMAEQFPDNDFLGVEVHRPGVGAVLNAIHAKQLKNVRIISEDILSVLQHIPKNSLDGVLIFFPDPWPKKRHHKRRLIQPNFIMLIIEKLKKNGYLHIATDWENYAEHIEEVLSQFPHLINTTCSAVMPRIATKFEERGKKLGHTIFEFVRLNSVGPNV